VPQICDATPPRPGWQALKFSWYNKKAAWFLKLEGYRKRHQKEYNLDEIRSMYGTKGKVNSLGTTKLNEEAESA